MSITGDGACDLGEGFFDYGGELTVGNEDAGLAVLKDEGDGCGV